MHLLLLQNNRFWFLIFLKYVRHFIFVFASKKDCYLTVCVTSKKVLSEYPEVKMTSEEQNASLGETYLELVKRLDEGIFRIMSSCA